jgi:NTP pyrophosphatase (non-canonical NTP hydrolase)
MEAVMSNIDLEQYQKFVEGVTSDLSNDTQKMTDRLLFLEKEYGVNMSLVMTGATGMSAEAGEFADEIKKIVWHGKPFGQDKKEHLEKELGDVIWYWINCCRALNLDPVQVIAKNVRKLETRYPGGKFDIFRSENRAEGDI